MRFSSSLAVRNRHAAEGMSSLMGPICRRLRSMTLRDELYFGSFKAPNRRRRWRFLPSSSSTRTFVAGPDTPNISMRLTRKVPIAVSTPLRAWAACSFVTRPRAFRS